MIGIVEFEKPFSFEEKKQMYVSDSEERTDEVLGTVRATENKDQDHGLSPLESIEMEEGEIMAEEMETTSVNLREARVEHPTSESVAGTDKDGYKKVSGLMESILSINKEEPAMVGDIHEKIHAINSSGTQHVD